jgi:hypothetical protein
MTDENSDKKQPWFVPVAIALLGSISAVAVAFLNKPPSPPSPVLPSTSPSVSVTPTTSAPINSSINGSTPSPDASVIPQNRIPVLNPPDGDNSKLTIEYDLSEFKGAYLRIGNTRNPGIIVVSDLTLQWDFSECPRLVPNRNPSGAPLIDYRYKANITQSRGSQLLDSKAFKYASGDIDGFHTELIYPGKGIYKVWMEFKYSNFGSSDLKIYKTQEQPISHCYS